MDKETNFCQSCGMPLTEDVLGTNADGSKNEDYCMYCYRDGKFLQECTMEEMIEHCAQFVNEVNKLSAMLNHIFHRALLKEFSVPVAIHAIIFVLTTVGVCTEHLVSQWHSATLTEFHCFFHISYFVLSFDAAKVLIVANSAKYLGYSVLICDEWFGSYFSLPFRILFLTHFTAGL